MDQSSKRIVRILVIVGIGIPVMIELVTLFGLVTDSMDDKKAGTAHRQSMEELRVKPGDEFLPATPAKEIIHSAKVSAQKRKWIFDLELQISGQTDGSYQLKLDSLRTRNGTLIPSTFKWEASTATDPIFKTQWKLPPGEQPDALILSAMFSDTTGQVQNISRKVIFDKVPVRGSTD